MSEEWEVSITVGAALLGSGAVLGIAGLLGHQLHAPAFLIGGGLYWVGCGAYRWWRGDK